MEVCSQPGMASDGPSDVSNKMIKAQTADLAFRVKLGWVAVEPRLFPTAVVAQSKALPRLLHCLR
jgi:hypothetical protein